MSRALDVMHLGHDRVIVAYERDGVIIDPGPESSIAALDGIDLQAVLLTHIHLDHAGATGTLVERNPKLRVYVHERGAPHLIDPSKLLKSAAQLYGDDMDRLWGRVVPIPEENITILRGGETVEGLEVEYTPGHASHHVAYFDPDSGEAYTGDVAGVRTPPSEWVLSPTPPPDIDVEKWLASIEIVAGWKPATLCLTHAGKFTDVDRHLDSLKETLHRHAECVAKGDRDAFYRLLADEVKQAVPDDATADRFEQAGPHDQMWLGLERYWRKRREREEADAA